MLGMQMSVSSRSGFTWRISSSPSRPSGYLAAVFGPRKSPLKTLQNDLFVIDQNNAVHGTIVLLFLTLKGAQRHNLPP